MAKTWKQKLEDKKEPKLQTLQKAMSGIPAGGTLLMPTAQSVKVLIDTIPAGQQISFQEMRQQLATSHKADLSCPMATSMVTRIVAEAAWEDIEAGKTPAEVTPFWRVIEPDSAIARKLACGAEFIESMRQTEGIG